MKQHFNALLVLNINSTIVTDFQILSEDYLQIFKEMSRKTPLVHSIIQMRTDGLNNEESVETECFLPTL